MIETPLEDVESIRILHAGENLKIEGNAPAEAVLFSGQAPEVHRQGSRADVVIGSCARLRVPAGVIIEVVDCSGNLEVEDQSAPFTLDRVGGNFRARRVGSVSIRNEVRGRVEIEDAQAIEAERIAGGCCLDGAGSARLKLVGGDLECRRIEGDLEIENVAGVARLHAIQGTVRSKLIGGRVGVELVGDLDLQLVGGKLKAVDVTRTVRVASVGGGLRLQGVGGKVSVDRVVGHARLGRIGGGIDLPDVGGAVDLVGPFPAGASWRTQSHGRARIALDPDASIELHARARRGRIRLRGVDGGRLNWIGPSEVRGEIGAGNPVGRPLELAMETSGADVLITGAGPESHEYDFRSRRRERHFHRFAGTWAGLAGDIRDDLPEFIRAVSGAARKFAADAGAASGGLARDVADEVRRSVNEALLEVERSLSELGESLPRDLAEKLSRLGRQIDDLLSQASRQARARSREARRMSRERLRDAVREMRDAMREAVREAGRRATEEAERSGGSATAASGSRESAADKDYDREILEILNKVERGEIEPEEADDLLSAWLEVERSADRP